VVCPRGYFLLLPISKVAIANDAATKGEWSRGGTRSAKKHDIRHGFFNAEGLAAVPGTSAGQRLAEQRKGVKKAESRQ